MTAVDGDRDERRRRRGLNVTPDFSEAVDDDPQLEARLELVWTVLSRAVDNGGRWDHIDESTALPMFHDVYLNGDGLTGGELSDLELFESDLSKDRTPDRSYTNLTATETSFLSILETGLNRISQGELVDEWDAYRESVSGGDR